MLINLEGDSVLERWKEADADFKMLLSGYLRSQEIMYGVDIPHVVHYVILAFCYDRLEKCSKAAIKFITEKYLELNTKWPHRKIFTHVGSATDKNSIKRMMSEVQSNLAGS